MRIAQVIFAGSLAALIGAVSPASARKADAQKPMEEKPISASCHTYQPAPGGTWTEHPCEEIGGPPQHKSAAKSPDDGPRQR
jgi:hypothetical protein